MFNNKGNTTLLWPEKQTTKSDVDLLRKLNHPRKY